MKCFRVANDFKVERFRLKRTPLSRSGAILAAQGRRNQKGPHHGGAGPFLLTDPKPRLSGATMVFFRSFENYIFMRLPEFVATAPCRPFRTRSHASIIEGLPFIHLKIRCLAALVAARACCRGSIAFR